MNPEEEEEAEEGDSRARRFGELVGERMLNCGSVAVPLLFAAAAVIVGCGIGGSTPSILASSSLRRCMVSALERCWFSEMVASRRACVLASSRPNCAMRSSERACCCCRTRCREGESAAPEPEPDTPEPEPQGVEGRLGEIAPCAPPVELKPGQDVPAGAVVRRLRLLTVRVGPAGVRWTPPPPRPDDAGAAAAAEDIAAAEAAAAAAAAEEGITEGDPAGPPVLVVEVYAEARVVAGVP